MRAMLIVVAALIAAFIMMHRVAATADTCSDACDRTYAACTKSCNKSNTDCFTKCINEHDSCLVRCK